MKYKHNSLPFRGGQPVVEAFWNRLQTETNYKTHKFPAVFHWSNGITASTHVERPEVLAIMNQSIPADRRPGDVWDWTDSFGGILCEYSANKEFCGANIKAYGVLVTKTVGDGLDVEAAMVHFLVQFPDAFANCADFGPYCEYEYAFTAWVVPETNQNQFLLTFIPRGYKSMLDENCQLIDFPADECTSPDGDGVLPEPDSEIDGTDHDHGHINSLPHDENHPDHYCPDQEAHPDHEHTEHHTGHPVFTEYGVQAGLRAMLKKAAELAKSGETTVSEDDQQMLDAVESLFLTEETSAP